MVSSLPNYFQEFLCSTVMFFLFGRVRTGRGGFFWIAFLTWPVISLTMNLGYWDALNTWAGADIVQAVRMLFLVLFITVGGLGYEGGWVRMLYVVLVSDVLMTTLTIVTAAVYGLVHRVSPGAVLQDANVICSIPMILCKMALFLVLAAVCYRPASRLRDLPFERYPLLKVIAVLVTLCMVNPVVYQMSIPEKRAGRNLVMGLYVMIAICTTIVIVLYIRAEGIRQQNLILQSQIQLTREYRGILDEQYEMARGLRHDIRRHIQTLTWAAEDAGMDPGSREKILAYRERMKAVADRLQTGDYTGHPYIDSMIFSMEQYCRERQIPFECRPRQFDFSALTERAGIDFAFAISYWIACCLQDKGSGAGAVRADGGRLAGNQYMKVWVGGRKAVPERDRRSREEIRRPLKEVGIESDISISEEDGGVCLRVDW